MKNAFGGLGPALLAVSWMFFSLTGILLAVRIYVRLQLSPHGTAALAWTVVAFVSMVVETICSTIATYYGLGQHIEVVIESGALSRFIFWTWMTCFWYILNVALSKVAAVSFLLALHADAHPRRRYLLHFVAVSMGLAAIPCCFLLWFQCNPPCALWNPDQQHGCNLSHNMDYTRFYASWSTACDIVLVILPIFLVYKLQMRTRTKTIICALMGLGIFSAVATAMVAYYVKDLVSEDFSYNISTLTFWGKASTWLVLISTSVPPVAPLFKAWAGQSSDALEHMTFDGRQGMMLLRNRSRSRDEDTGMGEGGFKMTRVLHTQTSLEPFGDKDANYGLDRLEQAYLGSAGKT